MARRMSDDDLSQLKDGAKIIGNQLKSSSRIIAEQIKSEAKRVREEMNARQSNSSKTFNARKQPIKSTASAKTASSSEDRAISETTVKRLVSSPPARASLLAGTAAILLICFALVQSCGHNETKPSPSMGSIEPEEIKAEAPDPISVSFPQDTALKAAVVAITNCYATDVLADDGGTYDAKKFHSYADISGFYLTVEDKGAWSPVDESTWQVRKLKLKNHNGPMCYQVDANVKQQNQDYVITRAIISYAPTFDAIEEENESAATEDLTSSDNHPYLSVPNNLVTQKRDIAAEKAQIEAIDSARAEETEYDNWVDSQFSLWNGDSDAFINLVKNQLNDSHSLRDTETNYIAIQDQDALDTVNASFSQNGSPVANMNDIYITMDFTAKNAFGARVKSQAHGIIRYPSGTVELLTIV